ncbi:MAG: orotidine-5'-phosphate decarboxylase [Bacteroidota bacterium]|nr:orotidine-5'-phosphate decarboxylase [Bacteroidota bacterium]MDP4225215.1 orotidine-5'-phosphate decarboxylase [Bacteroidota bacterium]MDP4274583.1 orotidine-5'-phosphate decarboxylase [Bacteroidota bacterium]
MNFEDIVKQIKKKKSFLCIGLDTDIHKIPKMLMKEEYPVFEFNKAIIDATQDVAVAYKPNIAFYESLGAAGWISLELTVKYLHEKFPEIFLIADAKRGDIGNTSKMYASAYFSNLDFDAVTVAPYMGEDSVIPFLSFEDKWVILLALTSNKGANDFQFIAGQNNGLKLFEDVLTISQQWGNKNNMMYVVGATRAEMLADVRKFVPDHFLLVPGIGAQGGSLSEVAKYGMNNSCGLLVNSSRGIIYADGTNRFAQAAREKAIEIQKEMEILLADKGII